MGLTFLGGIIIIGRDHHLWARLLFSSDIIILGHDYYNKMGLSSLDKIIFLGGIIFYFLILLYFFLLVYPLGQAIYIIWRTPLVLFWSSSSSRLAFAINKGSYRCCGENKMLDIVGTTMKTKITTTTTKITTTTKNDSDDDHGNNNGQRWMMADETVSASDRAGRSSGEAEWIEG